MSVLASADPQSVPDHIRISGDAKSPRELAKIMGRESGEEIQVKGGNFEENRAKANSKPNDLAYTFYLR